MCSVLSPFSSARLSATLWTAAARLLCPWDSPGKHPAVGCHALLPGVFTPQGLNPRLPYWQVDSFPWNHQGSPVL